MTRDEFMRTMDARGEAQKPRVEAQSGPSITVEEASMQLGLSTAQVIALIGSNGAIGYRAQTQDHEMRLPRWQFRTDGKLHAWVRPVCETFGENGWALVDFLTVPRSGLVVDRPFAGTLLEALQRGEIEFVIEAAARSNPP